jgi:hypothetical protein
MGDSDNPLHASKGWTIRQVEAGSAVKVSSLLTNNYAAADVYTRQEIWHPEQNIAVAKTVEKVNPLAEYLH